MMSTSNQRALAVFGNSAWSQNWTVDGVNFYGELMQLKTGMVCLCQQAFTAEQYEALQPPEGFIKSALQRNQFMLLPHKSTRWQWRLKRLSADLYQWFFPVWPNRVGDVINVSQGR